MIDAVEPEEGPTAFSCARRPTRIRHRSARGATMAEFALIAPMGFLLLMSIVVIGIVVTNFIQVTNVARAGARMAAICAGEQTTAPNAGTIPDGSSPALTCSVNDLDTYMSQHLTSIPASVTPTIQVCPATGGSCTSLSSSTSVASSGCNTSELIQVSVSYSQPLYLPLVGNFFESTPGSGSRTLQAQAEAGCE